MQQKCPTMKLITPKEVEKLQKVDTLQKIIVLQLETTTKEKIVYRNRNTYQRFDQNALRTFYSSPEQYHNTK